MATDTAPPTPSRWRNAVIYIGTILVAAGVTGGIVALLFNIREHQQEAKEHFVRLADLDENTIDPAVWGQNFPRQYDSYQRTADMERAHHGGSEAISKLDQDPFLKEMFAGYAFSLDFREKRGHAYMFTDQVESGRVKLRKQPGACLHCHTSVLKAYREQGNGDVMEGFKKVCAMPFDEAKKLVSHPVTCLDCHDPKTIALRVTRPAFLVGIKELAKSDDPVPHLPSIQRWRQGDRKQPYDPNTDATRQELRSFVCGQCHVEYYFTKNGNVVTYPWSNGLKAEQMEAYYDATGFFDWKHALTGAPMLKAQHPEFETWSQGIHARSGVSCADCHMPYKREGAVKVSDHHVRSPLLNIALACQTCHRYPEAELRARVDAIQQRTKGLLQLSETALKSLIDEIQAAKKNGASEKKLDAARHFHRRAQWRADLIVSENSLGFHASSDVARILAESIDYSRQGVMKLLKED